jgi:prepilin-type processing-associated H-X9-DG protein
MIEILVVMSVIAILSTLAMPGFNHARNLSRSVVCANNLRTLHQGLTFYTADHNGFYPAPTNNPLPTGGVGSWCMALMRGDYVGTSAVTANVKNPFLCPEAIRTYSNGQARRTYGMNSLPFTDSASSPIRMSCPGQTLLLADSIDGGVGDGDAIFYFRSSSINRVEARHSNLFNALFVDGHVESLSKLDPSTTLYMDNLQK